MPGLRLRLRTTCVTCGNPIPMSAASLAMECPTCDAPRRLSPGDFRWFMESRMSSPVAASVASASGAQPVVLGEAQVALVTCGACGARIDDSAIEASLADGGVTCQCGRDISVREVPPALDSERWWTAFIGESTSARVPPATDPVHFTCPHCGAGLMVDGTTRTPACSHCATRPYLPDDLWRAVRPTPKAEPFYLWVDPTWYERWSSLKVRRTRAVLLTAGLVVIGMAGAFAATAFFEPTESLFGTSESGGPVPWYDRALFSVVFSWMVAMAASTFVSHRMNPTRTRS